jgi:hypothetical protein
MDDKAIQKKAVAQELQRLVKLNNIQPTDIDGMVAASVEASTTSRASLPAVRRPRRACI